MWKKINDRVVCDAQFLLLYLSKRCNFNFFNFLFIFNLVSLFHNWINQSNLIIFTAAF